MQRFFSHSVVDSTHRVLSHDDQSEEDSYLVRISSLRTSLAYKSLHVVEISRRIFERLLEMRFLLVAAVIAAFLALIHGHPSGYKGYEGHQLWRLKIRNNEQVGQLLEFSRRAHQQGINFWSEEFRIDVPVRFSSLDDRSNVGVALDRHQHRAAIDSQFRQILVDLPRRTRRDHQRSRRRDHRTSVASPHSTVGVQSERLRLRQISSDRGNSRLDRSNGPRVSLLGQFLRRWTIV